MQPYFRFDSLTNAQSAKRLLQRYGIASAVRRDPQPDRRHGCGFALFVSGNQRQAQKLLREHGFLDDDPRER